MEALTAALLALVGSFVGGVGGVLWGRRHAVRDRLAETVLAFNQVHVRYLFGTERLAAVVRDANDIPPEKARELLDSTRKEVDGTREEGLACYAAIELWFGVDSRQRHLAEIAHRLVERAQWLAVVDASELEGDARTAKLREAGFKLLEAADKRKELVTETRRAAGIRRRFPWRLW